MTGTIDVEDVLSKLNNVEKISLLAGSLSQISSSPQFLTDEEQEPTGGIPSLSPNMGYLQFESPTGQMACGVLNSSTASQRRVFLAGQLWVQLGTPPSYIKQVLQWDTRAERKAPMSSSDLPSTCNALLLEAVALSL